MRLHARNMTPDVFLHQPARRTVVLRFAGLRITMTPTEARALADQLHDTADRSEP